jgi:hypothetical protein
LPASTAPASTTTIARPARSQPERKLACFPNCTFDFRDCRGEDCEARDRASRSARRGDDRDCGARRACLRGAW